MPELKLPPGAKLVNDSAQGMKLPPGATLVSGGGAAAPNDPPPSLIQSLANGTLDLAKGVGEGVLNTANGIAAMDPIHRAIDWGARKLSPSYAQQQDQADRKLRDLATPTNTAQAVGRGLEQAAEFMVPGMGEEAAAAKLPRAIAPLARIGMGALDSGVLNKAQGGSFTTGALTGGAGSGVGEGLRAVAPKFAEVAMGVRKADRFNGKTPGQSILNYTRGVLPETVANSARTEIGNATNQMHGLLANSTATTSLQPTRDFLNKALTQAQAENNPQAIEQIQKLIDQVSTNHTTGLPLATIQPPQGLLNLKRGLGKAVGSWDRDPAVLKDTTKLGRQAYRLMDAQLDQAEPATAALNQKISGLIPVVNRAESIAHSSDTLQRIVGRLAAHTGALSSGIGLGLEGYHQGGVGGAILGSLAGLAVPELAASPTAQMIAARGFSMPTTRTVLIPLAKGSLSQLDRKGSGSR